MPGSHYQSKHETGSFYRTLSHIPILVIYGDVPATYPPTYPGVVLRLADPHMQISIYLWG